MFQLTHLLYFVFKNKYLHRSDPKMFTSLYTNISIDSIVCGGRKSARSGFDTNYYIFKCNVCIQIANN